MLDRFIRGFESIPGNHAKRFDLIRAGSAEHIMSCIRDSEETILGFPLYFLSMPGDVMRFIEALPERIGTGKRLMTLVQSGFPETAQFEPLLRYLETLPGRIGFSPGGSIAKGFGSSVETLPPRFVEADLAKLEALGESAGRGEAFDAAVVESLAQPVRLDMKWLALFKVMRILGLLDSFTRRQLRTNRIPKRSSRAQPLRRYRES
ncbi:MAG TPA: hypothetical protein VMC79_10795 [Rectinemataceae bacterium]|nr:hypothetical protein [Rectinemataceae bacterium]